MRRKPRGVENRALPRHDRRAASCGARQVTVSGNNVGKTTSANRADSTVYATVRIMTAPRLLTPARAGPVMAKIGYARVSTRSQRDDSQVDDLTACGCDKIFTDTASGKLAARPELDKALAYLREGDVLVITRLSRAMRSLKHLLALADELRERGVGLVVLKQQIDTTTPPGGWPSTSSARLMSSSAS